MASTAFLIALVVVVMVTAPVMATDHWVGDEQGWKLNFDYKIWAATKEFHSSSTSKEPHNVYSADEEAFQSCIARYFVSPLISGNDVITLTTPGKRWLLCGVGKHCENGMKLAINVLPQLASPAPSPSY
ncbi:blue copper protein-like [Lycium ferocissimum]|uniref:blue copper protein-like n=1 Tax=Lycium ferocissimum TaxID=112874 RepID=UPI00281678BA|nr:blue copper protein-like [Lycium ferocissimum]